MAVMSSHFTIGCLPQIFQQRHATMPSESRTLNQRNLSAIHSSHERSSDAAAHRKTRGDTGYLDVNDDAIYLHMVTYLTTTGKDADADVLLVKLTLN
jgi:hypothetical protein